MKTRFFLLTAVFTAVLFVSSSANADPVTSWNLNANGNTITGTLSITSTSGISTIDFNLPVNSGGSRAVLTLNFSLNVGGQSVTGAPPLRIQPFYNGVSDFLTVSYPVPPRQGQPANTGVVTVSGTVPLGVFEGPADNLNFVKLYDLTVNLSGQGSTTTFLSDASLLTASGTSGTITLTPVGAEVPEPATMALLGSGLALLGIRARRKKQ